MVQYICHLLNLLSFVLIMSNLTIAFLVLVALTLTLPLVRNSSQQQSTTAPSAELLDYLAKECLAGSLLDNCATKCDKERKEDKCKTFGFPLLAQPSIFACIFLA